LVGERDGEVRLAAARLAGEDQVAALGDELRPEVGPELLAPECRLEDEVELLDGLEVREVSVAHELLDARVAAMRDLLGEQKSEPLAMRPSLLRCADLVVAEDAR